MDLSIIIPALNERTKIRSDIEAAWSFAQDSGLQAEIIVVADGSSDDTIEVAESCRASIPIVNVLPPTAQRGKGAAIKRGVFEASGEIIMFADAGLCVPYAEARLGLDLLRAGACDVAHGSRGASGSRVIKGQPKWRRLGSRGFAALIHSTMGIPADITDTQCGFKLYNGAVARDLYGGLFTNGYMFDLEIIMRALRRGYRIREFPVRWSNDADSRYHPIKGTYNVIVALAKIRMRLLNEAPISSVNARGRDALESAE